MMNSVLYPLAPQQKVLYDLCGDKANFVIIPLDQNMHYSDEYFTQKVRCLDLEILSVRSEKQPGLTRPVHALQQNTPCTIKTFSFRKEIKIAEIYDHLKESREYIPKPLGLTLYLCNMLDQGTQVVIFESPAWLIDASSLRCLATTLLGKPSASPRTKSIGFLDTIDWFIDNTESTMAIGSIDYFNQSLKIEAGFPYLRHPSGIHKGHEVRSIDTCDDRVETLITFVAALSQYFQEEKLTVWVHRDNRDVEEFKTGVGCFSTLTPIVFDLAALKTHRTIGEQIRKTLKNRANERYLFDPDQIDENYYKPIIHTSPNFVFLDSDEAPWPELEFLHQSDPVPGKVCMNYQGNGRARIRFDRSFFSGPRIDDLMGVIDQFNKDVSSKSTLDLQAVKLTNRDPMIPTNLASARYYESSKSAEKWPTTSNVVSLVENVVTKWPDLVALQDESKSLTYSKMWEIAANIACHLANDKGIGEGSTIGILMQPGVSVVCSILGILKAGLTYLPLDIQSSDHRLTYMIEKSQCAKVIVDRVGEARCPNTLKYDMICQQHPANRDAVVQVPPDSLAYINFTSGSTGSPKGVKVTHKNAIYSTVERMGYYGNTEDTRFLLTSSFSFDGSVAVIFGTLSTGGRVCIPQQKTVVNAESVCRYISDHRITNIQTVPSYYSLILENQKSSQLKSLKSVIVAGEALQQALVRDHFSKLPDTLLFNEYGPTETTVWNTVKQIGRDDTENITIGSCIPGTSAYIWDQYQKPVPAGIVGELYIGGPAVAAGYINDSEKTSKSFISYPCGQEGQTLLYRTGDFVRLTDDAEIEFKGRRDHQVKVRGFRIELGEIEANALNIEQILECCAVVKPAGLDKSIFLYYAPREGTSIDAVAVRDLLTKTLPSYMIPNQIVCHRQLPKNSTGKIDRQALEKAEVSKPRQVIQGPPLSPIQAVVKETIENHLGFAIGIQDDIFSMGLNSLSSARVCHSLRKSGLPLSLKELFSHPTIDELSSLLEGRKI